RSLPLSSPAKCSDFRVSCRIRSSVSPDSASVCAAAGNGTTSEYSAIAVMVLRLPDLSRAVARQLKCRARLARLVERVQRCGGITRVQIDNAEVVHAARAVLGLEELISCQIESSGGGKRERQVV